MNLRDELMAVRSRYGELTPANVVEAARPDDAPLHSHFEWDDTIAGEKYRLIQGGELIRRVKITYNDGKNVTHEARAFLPVRHAESNVTAYEPTEDALSDPVLREVLLAEFEREWRRFKSKYEDLAEFASIISRDLAA